MAAYGLEPLRARRHGVLLNGGIVRRGSNKTTFDRITGFTGYLGRPSGGHHPVYLVHPCLSVLIRGELLHRPSVFSVFSVVNILRVIVARPQAVTYYTRIGGGLFAVQKIYLRRIRSEKA